MTRGRWMVPMVGPNLLGEAADAGPEALFWEALG